jgi:hypothetical protein
MWLSGVSKVAEMAACKLVAFDQNESQGGAAFDVLATVQDKTLTSDKACPQELLCLCG